MKKILISVCVAVAFLISASSASAAYQSVQIGTGQATSTYRCAWNFGACQYLTNTPGGYFMGALIQGEWYRRNTLTNPAVNCPGASPTDGAWWYTASNCSDYSFGKIPRVGEKCLWVGPSVSAQGMRSWLVNGQGVYSGDLCSRTRQLSLQNRANIGKWFNCAAGYGNGPSHKLRTVASTPFYANVYWATNGDQYSVSGPRDPLGTLPVGSIVQYRYTTLDGGYLVVYSMDYGAWGFVAAGSVNRTEAYGYYAEPRADTKTSCPV